MVCWKIWTWFRIMKISVSSKSFEMHLSFSFAASFCSSVSKSEKLPQMKKSHESNVLRSKAGFSAQMISWVSAARSEKQILSLLRASSSCALERISRSGAVYRKWCLSCPFACRCCTIDHRGTVPPCSQAICPCCIPPFGLCFLGMKI